MYTRDMETNKEIEAIRERVQKWYENARNNVTRSASLALKAVHANDLGSAREYNDQAERHYGQAIAFREVLAILPKP